MKDKISIIVPIFNSEKTLDKCIESLIAQTYNNLEIILVNDGSIDNSLNICRKYKQLDQRIIIIDKKNGGVSSARNAGIDIATGEYIMFCDSDDWVEKNWCQILFSNFEKNSLVMSGAYVEGNQEDYPHEVKADGSKERISRIDFYAFKLKLFNVPWNKIYDKKIIDTESRYDEEISNGEDYLFNIQYLTGITDSIILLDNCTYHYTWEGKASLSNKVPDNYVTQCKRLFHLAEISITEIGTLSEKNRKRFYTDFYNQFQKTLFFCLQNKEKKLCKRLKEGNQIMKTPEYQICVNNAEISTNKIFTFVSRMKSCYALWILMQLRTKRGNRDGSYKKN